MSDETRNVPRPFVPSPHLSDEINRNIIDSEINGGAWLEKLADGRALRFKTANSTYRLWADAEGWLIEGHPKYCPTPTRCVPHGSTWGGSMLKMGWVGVGMHFECGLGDRVMTTSEIESVNEEAV